MCSYAIMSLCNAAIVCACLNGTASHNFKACVCDREGEERVYYPTSNR